MKHISQFILLAGSARKDGRTGKIRKGEAGRKK